MKEDDDLSPRLWGVSLFSGVAGIEIGLHQEVKTVAYVEREPYAQAVLIKRMREGLLDSAPIYDDVRTFDGSKYRGLVDIVFGGFPCQDISVAGKGAGIKEGTRSGLFYELMRVVGEIRPPFIFLENVPTITNRGLDVVLATLSEAGYDAKWITIRASDVGAPHRRERWFCLAYSNDGFLNAKKQVQAGRNSAVARASPTNIDEQWGDGVYEREQNNKRISIGGNNKNRKSIIPLNEGEVWLETTNDRGKRGEGKFSKEVQRLPSFSWCKNVGRIEDLFGRPNIPEPLVRGGNDGIPKRVDRLKCLGNAVVPQQCRKAWGVLTK